MSPSTKPAIGASSTNSALCESATPVAPRLLPTTIDIREPGATITACKKPLWRSSITLIVVKIAVDSTTITSTPG